MKKFLSAPFLIGVLTRVGGQVLAFATVMVASRYLGLSGFGTYALAWAAAVVANTYVFTGLYHAVLRCARVEDDGDTLFWMMAAVGLAGSTIIACIGWLAGGTGSGVGSALWAIAPIPTLQSVVAWNEARLVHAGRVRAASVYVLLSETVAFVTAILAFRAGFGVSAMIMARYGSVLSGLALTTLLAPRLPRLALRLPVMRQGMQTALPLWATTSVGMFSNYGADFILGLFLTPAAVGAYRGGARIATTASDIVLQPLMMLTWARFARLEKAGETDQLRQAWRENIALSTALVWPVMVSVALLAPNLVVTIFDKAWLPAAGIVAILSLARGFQSVSILLEPTMVCNGRPGAQLRIRAIGAGLLLVLLLAFGRHGGQAAAYSQLVTGAAVAGLSLAAMGGLLRIRLPELVTTFLPGLSLTLACIAVIRLTQSLRDTLGADPGLAATVGVLGLVWLSVMTVYITRRILVLPTH